VVQNDESGVNSDEHDETIIGAAESLLTFENAALPLTLVCPEGQIVMANRAMRELLGYEFSDLVGRSMHDVVVANSDEWSRAWEQRIQGGERVTPERRMQLRRGNGAEITVLASSVLVTDGQGAVRYVVARAVPART
jgi:PAS domain S-box-containing protein